MVNLELNRSFSDMRSIKGDCNNLHWQRDFIALLPFDKLVYIIKKPDIHFNYEIDSCFLLQAYLLRGFELLKHVMRGMQSLFRKLNRRIDYGRSTGKVYRKSGGEF